MNPWRTLAIGSTASIVAATVMLTPSLSSGAAVTASTDSPVRVTFASGASSWKPSANARVSGSRSISSAQVRPKRATGRKTISMRSSTSALPVGPAGTAVRVTARLRTTQPGRRLTLRITERAGGRVVASRATTVKPANRHWKAVSTGLRTTRPDSRIQLQVVAQRMASRHLVRVSALEVTAVPATTATTAPVVPVVPATRPILPTAPCEQIDYSDPAQGVRTFTEDFSGNQIDRSTWRVRDDTFLNQDQAWITKDAVSVHDGYLDIAGRRLADQDRKTNFNALYPLENMTRDYSTGYIDTIDSAGYGNAAGNRFGQKYGHFEMRAWVPSESTMSRGIWPAFWLRADHQSGEIDPMESYGGPTIRSFDPSSSYEWNSWADTAQGSLSGIVKQMTQGRADVGQDKIWQGWHTYGVNWSPGCLRYLYDGRTVGLVRFDDPTTKPYFRGPTFDDTFHLRLNMQIGSKYWGWADREHTRDAFSYKVDWVRVYQGNELLGR
jgi:beta-glucanase (GH16 family)